MKQGDYRITIWALDEFSTRNCVHSRVYQQDKRILVYCDKGHHLSQYDKYRKDGRFPAMLPHILHHRGHLPEACQKCPDFEHDEPVAKLKLGKEVK